MRLLSSYTKVTARIHHLPDIVARSLWRYFKSSESFWITFLWKKCFSHSNAL